MVAGNTGASHLSRKSRPPKGALISQPIVDAIPRMISGMVMTQRGLVRFAGHAVGAARVRPCPAAVPAAPWASLCSIHRAWPPKTSITCRLM